MALREERLSFGTFLLTQELSLRDERLCFKMSLLSDELPLRDVGNEIEGRNKV